MGIEKSSFESESSGNICLVLSILFVFLLTKVGFGNKGITLFI